jgi:hypothetical protein
MAASSTIARPAEKLSAGASAGAGAGDLASA